MQIETLGEAWDAGVGAWMACAWGPHTKSAMKRGRECTYRLVLDMPTLVATRGRDFPVARLAERLRCPACGSRLVRVVWNFPGAGARQAAPGG